MPLTKTSKGIRIFVPANEVPGYAYGTFVSATNNESEVGVYRPNYNIPEGAGVWLTIHSMAMGKMRIGLCPEAAADLIEQLSSALAYARVNT